MTKRDEDTRNLWIGVIIGAATMGTISIFLAARNSSNNKEKTLGLVGKALENVGCILEKHNIKEPRIMKDVEKKIEKHDCLLTEIINWGATGFQLWKNIKG